MEIKLTSSEKAKTMIDFLIIVIKNQVKQEKLNTN